MTVANAFAAGSVKSQETASRIFTVIRKGKLKKLKKPARTKVINPIDKFTMPDIQEIAEKEWETYIANMALNNIRGKFSDKVIDIFLELSKGKTPKEIAEEMEIPANTVSVYKKRVTAKLCEEIRRLNIELG